MGCGCNKRRKRQQSSRMPISSEPNKPKIKHINGITVPNNPTPNQRRSAIAKINNGKINRAKNQTVADAINARKSLG